MHTAFLQEPDSLMALDRLLATPSPRCLVLRLYNAMQVNPPKLCPCACEDWQRDLTPMLTPDVWSYCCGQAKALFPNYGLHLIHVKYLHLLYHTPVQLHRMGLRDDAHCACCALENADFLHLAGCC